MRSKSTNYLQVAVLIAGIVYMAAGILFLVSPSAFAKVLPLTVDDDTFNQIKLDEILVMLLSYARILSISLFFAGFSMIMPLFDPLKYRGMIYMYGVFAPLGAVLFSAYQWFLNHNKSLLCFLAVFSFLFVLNLSGLLATKKEAGMGVE